MLVNAVNQNGPYGSQFCALQGARATIIEATNRVGTRGGKSCQRATHPSYSESPDNPLALHTGNKTKFFRMDIEFACFSVDS